MSKSVMKWLARVMFYAVAVGLFVYAATRSADFIVSTMPANQQIVGYLGLLATGGGAIAWLAVFLFYASGTGQKGLSMLMVVIDLLGEFALYTADTLYRSGETGVIAALPAETIRMVILGLSVLIAANIAATFAFHLIDPETSKRMREESARDVLDDEVLRTIEQRAPQLANQMVPVIIAQWEADFVSRFTDMTALGLGSLPTAQNTILDSEGNDITPQATRRGAPAWLVNMRRKFAKRGNGNGNGRTYEATDSRPAPVTQAEPATVEGGAANKTPAPFRDDHDHTPA